MPDDSGTPFTSYWEARIRTWKSWSISHRNQISKWMCLSSRLEACWPSFWGHISDLTPKYSSQPSLCWKGHYSSAVYEQGPRTPQAMKAHLKRCKLLIREGSLALSGCRTQIIWECLSSTFFRGNGYSLFLFGHSCSTRPLIDLLVSTQP